MSKKENNEPKVIGFFAKVSRDCYLKDDVDQYVAGLKSVITSSDKKIKALNLELTNLRFDFKTKVNSLDRVTKDLNAAESSLVEANGYIKRNRELNEKLKTANKRVEGKNDEINSLKADKVALNKEHKEAMARMNEIHIKATRGTSKAAADAILKADKDKNLKRLKEENGKLSKKLKEVENEVGTLREKLEKRGTKVMSTKYTEEQLADLLNGVTPKMGVGKKSFTCEEVRIIRKVNEVDGIPAATISQFLETGNSIISRIVNKKTYTKCD